MPSAVYPLCQLGSRPTARKSWRQVWLQSSSPRGCHLMCSMAPIQMSALIHFEHRLRKPNLNIKQQRKYIRVSGGGAVGLKCNRLEAGVTVLSSGSYKQETQVVS